MKIEDTNLETIKHIDCDIDKGLSLNQVLERKKQGLFNYEVVPKLKTTKQIFINNIFTYFNVINFILAIFILAVGSLKNVFFIGVVISNILIGIFQELKVRNIIKKLAIVSQPQVSVIRNGKQIKIKTSEVVLDDIVIFNAGDQIIADAVVADGDIEVDESLITGESDLILKKKGDKLISGSVVISGNCIAKIDSVGNQTYVSKILMDVGKYEDTKNRSEMMNYINIIVKIVSVIIFPIGAMRFYKEYFLLHNSLQDSVVFTVASVIGMIPEGIVLLTSIALMIGVLRLAKIKTLTQDLFCLETLAKVDILCLDKTGTLTQGDIEVEEVIKLDDNYNMEDIKLMIYNFCLSTRDNGTTINGLKKKFVDNSSNNENKKWGIQSRVYFSSERKWSGINFDNGVNIVLGAPEVLLGQNIYEYEGLIKKYAAEGKRIMVMGRSKQKLTKDVLPEVRVEAFIVMSDKIRENAIETLKFFKEEGVEIKIISGDNAASVARIARAVGLDGSDKYIDARELKTEEDINEAIKRYNIFGRTKPNQKKRIINGYQKLGHTVGMIGDGINDILALKDADCSIAMATGSDAVRQISKFVLLDSDFKSVPNIVKEGRRVVNNIIRSASMFLIKNIYSFVLSIILLFFSSSYPFQPIQLTLIGALTIGMPSFFLVLEPNKEPIRGSFLKKVVANALMPSIAIIWDISFINIISNYLIPLTSKEISTLAIILTGFCNLMALIRISKPFNMRHKLIVLLFSLLFVISIIFFKDLFLLCSVNLKMIVIIIILGSFSYWLINLDIKN